jgi:hypothetical protein
MSQDQDPLTLFGMITSIHQALQVVSACLEGLIPILTMRLSECEKDEVIASGNIFVFLEKKGTPADDV